MPNVSEYRAFVRVEGRGNAPQAQAVWDHFEHYGAVSDVYNPTSSPDTSYVSFSLPEELEAALSETPTIIAGVTCSVQRALPRGEASRAPGPIASSSAPPDRVYVTGLVESCTEESLRSYFSTYGAVQDVYIPIDRMLGERKPFAFVSMTSPEEVESIIREPTHCTLDGHKINCDVAAARGAMQSKGKGGGYHGAVASVYREIGDYHESTGKGSGYHGAIASSSVYRHTSVGPYIAAASDNGGYGKGVYSSNGIRPLRAPAVMMNTPAVAKPNQGVPGDHRIFVFGMPEGLNADMLRGHFARHGEILDIYVPNNKPDIAYITFSIAEELQDALLNSGLRIAGYWVKGVKPAESKKGGSGKGRPRPYMQREP